MKQGTKLVLLGIACVIGIILSATFLFSTAEKVFNPVTLETSIIVSNRAEKKYLDTILSVGATEMGLSDIFLNIRRMDPDKRFNADGMENLAYVYGDKNVFIIFIQNMSREQAIEIVAHELIHVWQMNTGKLITPVDHTIIYEGTIYKDPRSIEYYSRPWEVEARAKGEVLEMQIKDKLYGK